MKKIDERVLDIEKADSNTKFKHNYALKTNVTERILNTPNEKFDLIENNHVLLRINNDIKIILREVDSDVKIRM